MTKRSVMARKSKSTRLSRFKICAQIFNNNDGKIRFQVTNSRGEMFEVPAAALFYGDNWLKSFSCNDIRRIACAALESELVIEKYMMNLLRNSAEEDDCTQPNKNRRLTIH